MLKMHSSTERQLAVSTITRAIPDEMFLGPMPTEPSLQSHFIQYDYLKYCGICIGRLIFSGSEVLRDREAAKAMLI